MILIAITSASLPTKKRILTVCVKLFLEKGYKQTTLAEINEKAGVSFSQFQNIFRAKDGVLTELVEFMFENQFAMARSAAGAKLPPIYVYAVETAIQMTLTELNENLREIYIEAYTQKEASEFIFRETAKELYQIFGPYQPELTARDFYDMEIGSASIMRGYMAHPCDEELTLEKKLRLFLTMSLRAYNVPKEETEQAIRFVEGLDIRTISERVMQELFKALAKKNGLILLTDSDAAGFRIRNYITNMVGAENVVQAYVPAIHGKEKRKAQPGKEGLLGVEGVDDALVRQALLDALGAEAGAAPVRPAGRQITYTDLYEWGLSGKPGSAERKARLLNALGLPPRISKKELVEAFNRLYTFEQLDELQLKILQE